jgi:hypothetical protein
LYFIGTKEVLLNMKLRRLQYLWGCKLTGYLVLLAMLFSLAGGALSSAPVYADHTGGPSVDGNTLVSSISVTLELSKDTAQPGDSVTASGRADANTWVSIKVLDSAQSVIVFDAVKSGAAGGYSCTFKVPGAAAGTLTVVAGYGDNVANKTITVSATPGDTTAPTWPDKKLFYSDLSQSGVTLSWSGATDNVGVTGYKVYRGTVLLTTVPAGESSYTVTGLSAGITYTFTVQAVDAAGNESSDGPSITVTTTRSNGGGGGGGSSALQAVTSTTGTAAVPPGAGGTISLGNEAAIIIPANALQGTLAAEVKIQKVDQPPAVPAGFRLAGAVYQFSVGGAKSYSFAKKATIKISFDPDLIKEGEVPTLQYYDPAQAKWVDIGGSVSGNFVTARVDHLTMFAVLVTEEKEEEVQPSPEAFKDIAGHWAADNINELVSLGAIAGYPDGTFRPDSSITRAEFATVLAQAFKLAPQNGKVFTDTAAHWARDYIATAAANGIVSGYDDTTFGPDRLITREQMAMMVVKAAGLSPKAGETSFADSGSISLWAGEAVSTAVENGIIGGYPDNTVRPLGNASRAEAATVIVRIKN